MINKINNLLSVLFVLIAYIIPCNVSAKSFTRNGYDYQTIGTSSSVTMSYSVSQVGRSTSLKNKIWWCTDGVWYDNGIPVYVKDLNVSQQSDNAETLAATGIYLTSITRYIVPGLTKAILGHEHADYVKCTIKASAFANVSSTLKNLEIDKSIGGIESKAFWGMKDGKIIFQEMNPPSLEPDAFNDEAYENVLVIVPDTKLSLFMNSEWNKFKNIIPLSQYYLNFSEATYLIPIGSSKTLSFTADVDFSELQWMSSDNSIAEVTDGIVKGISYGEATITAINKYGNEVNCKVIVEPTVESLEIIQSEYLFQDGILILDQGTSLDLNSIIRVLPEDACDKTLSWSCKNPELVYITNNKLYARNPGKTELIATAVSGVSISLQVFIKYPSKFIYDGLEYEIISEDEKTCKLNGIYNNNIDSVVIPSELDLIVDTYKVISIADYAFKDSKLTSISIPNTVTNIPGQTFAGCKNLKNIIIEDGYIPLNFAKGVFDGVKIEELYLGRSFKYEYYSIYERINSPFGYKTSLNNVYISKTVQSLPDRAFEGCCKIEHIEIPNSLNHIGNRAFKDCEKLKKVLIENGEETLNFGTSVFEGVNIEELFLGRNFVCTTTDAPFCNQIYLSNVHISNNLSYISDNAFYGCSGLSHIEIPTSVTSIGFSAFEGCCSLTKIVLSTSLTSIGNSAFRKCTDLSLIEIPTSITSIESSVFSGCSSLSHIEIPTSVTSIGSSAFLDCSNLKQVEIPTSVTTIGSSAFSGCSNLKQVEIPNSVISIGEWAFMDCNNLSSVTFEGNCVLSYGIFDSCVNISSIKCLSNIPSIQAESANYIFSSLTTSRATLYVPIGCREVYERTLPWKLVKNIEECQFSEIEVNSLSLNASDLSLNIGDKYQLFITILPEDATDKTITWSSSDPNVVTVDANGLVNAVGIGEAIIAATSSNGLTSSCTVSVLPILVQSILLDPNEVCSIIGETFNISAIVLPKKATNKTVSWSSSDESIATVDDNGKVIIKNEGFCKIIASATDGSEVVGECYITSVSGIEELFNYGDDKISVYSLQGVMIYKDCKAQDIKRLSPGVYIVVKENRKLKVIIH